MDIRRFYVVSQRDERGPFSIEELAEELDAGRIAATQQVRTGMGTMLGSVREVIDAPKTLWNTSETASGLSPVALAQRRNRMVSLIILGSTLIPAGVLIAWFGDGSTTVAVAPSSATTTLTVPAPPPRSGSAITSTAPAHPPASTAMTPTASPANPATPSRPVAATPGPQPAAAESGEPVRQGADGVVMLMASAATITTRGARLQAKASDNPHIGSWNFDEGGVEWNAMIERPGTFLVTLTYACNRSGAGAELGFTADQQTIADLTIDTGSWEDFKPHRLRRPLTISRTGMVKFTLAPIKKKTSAFMKLVGVVLTPQR